MLTLLSVRLICVVLVVLVLIRCTLIDIQKSHKELGRYTELVNADKDEMPNYEAFKGSHVFPFFASFQSKSQIINNYNSLHVGLSKIEVQEILGSPHYSMQLGAKKKYTYLGSTWVYFFEKPDPNLVNQYNDKSLQLFFGPYGKLSWVSSNIDLLLDISSPHT